MEYELRRVITREHTGKLVPVTLALLPLRHGQLDREALLRMARTAFSIQSGNFVWIVPTM